MREKTTLIPSCRKIGIRNHKKISCLFQYASLPFFFLLFTLNLIIRKQVEFCFIMAGVLRRRLQTFSLKLILTKLENGVQFGKPPVTGDSFSKNMRLKIHLIPSYQRIGIYIRPNWVMLRGLTKYCCTIVIVWWRHCLIFSLQLVWISTS